MVDYQMRDQPVITPAARFGWIGLGKMGSRMAPRLAAAGYQLVVFDVDPERGAALSNPHIGNAKSAEVLAEVSDVLFTMLPNDEAFLQVIEIVRKKLRAESCIIDMSTTSPTASKTAAALLRELGIGYLRAPVSGSTVLAEQGTLSILVSGPSELFEAARSAIGVFGQNISYLGQAEEARVAKLVVNSILAALNNALAEALSLGRRGGLDWESMIDIISNSAVGSAYITSKLDKLKQQDWTAAAPISLIAKDVDLALAFGREHGAFMPMTALVRQILAAIEARGGSELDMSSVVTFYQ